MATGSKKVIYAALAGNMLIAITKSIASAITGSSAMLSEALHSFVDTGNQGLLLYGLKRAAKPADARYPFGYGMELYFWTFVVAILIFAVGGGISIYEGIHKIQHPEPVSSAWINYTVLGLAMVFEAVAWWIAFKEFRLTKGDKGYLEAVRSSKDPTIFTVLFEDTAAMLGLIVAMIGIALSQALEMPMLDGAASIVIGVILNITAMVLAFESKGLLIGESADPATLKVIKEKLASTPGIDHVNECLSMHMGPQDILLTISLDFSDGLSSAEVETLIGKIDREVKTTWPSVKRLFIEAQSMADHAASTAN
ncbi:MAG: cation transporter [Rickettsiales bacterium]|nr:cation transporter [Rickettsiales bacterium]|tara:strand:- start:2827 stop:3756 length:930 start_codon:yes stop_codon:yes gene_type:complete